MAKADPDQLFLRSEITQLLPYRTYIANQIFEMSSWYWTEIHKNKERAVCFGMRVSVDKDFHAFADPKFGDEPVFDGRGTMYQDQPVDPEDKDGKKKGTMEGDDFPVEEQDYRLHFALEVEAGEGSKKKLV